MPLLLAIWTAVFGVLLHAPGDENRSSAADRPAHSAPQDAISQPLRAFVADTDNRKEANTGSRGGADALIAPSIDVTSLTLQPAQSLRAAVRFIPTRRLSANNRPRAPPSTIVRAI